MAKRKIIEIDRDLCDGCGLCTTACAEGALELDGENKAVLVREIYCDGMGACLDVCPTDALKIVERESAGYNSQAAYDHVLKTRGKEAAAHVHGIGDDAGHHGHVQAHNHGQPHGQRQVQAPRHPLMGGCPGSAACEIPELPESWEEKESGRVTSAEKQPVSVKPRSELRQWPIQLNLVSPFAPYFQNADLLVAADCTAFALGSFHQDLLKGKKLIIACPKLDETEAYAEKLGEIIKQNNLKSLTVAIMTVPCCSGLRRIVEEAVELSGVNLSVQTKIIGIDGKLAA